MNVRKSVRQLEKLEQAGTLGKDDKALLKHGRFLLAEPGRIAPFYRDINYFSLLIRNCLNEGLEMGILIFFDGRVGEFDGYGWSTHHTGVRVDPREPHIYLSIPYLLQPFVDRDVLDQIIMPRQLEKQEVKLLEHIRTKEVRDVSLKLRDGVITRIDVTRPGAYTAEQRRALVDLLRLSGFERLMIDINDPDNMRIDSTKKYLQGIWYYKARAKGVGVNVRASELNAAFASLLKNFEFDKKRKAALARVIEDRLRLRLKDALEQQTVLKKQRAELKAQLEVVEERYDLGKITDAMFEKFAGNNQSQIDQIDL